MVSSKVGKLILKIPFFEWKIDIELFKGKVFGEELYSPIFYTHHYSEKSENKWLLSVAPKGIKDAKGCIQIVLYNYSLDVMQASVSVSFLNNDNIRVGEGFLNTWFGKDGLIFSTSFDENFIKDPKNNMLKDNKLTVVCNIVDIITIDDMDPASEVGSETEETLTEETPKKKFKVFDTFEKVLENKKFSDVTIIAKEKSYYLHKCILASSSVVFDAMFTNDIKEKNVNIVEIKDIEKKVLDKFFQYIYTGKVDDIHDVAVDLLSAAEKYAVKGLKTLCEESMDIHLNRFQDGSSKAIEYLNLAITNNAEVLKASVIRCLAKHFEEELFEEKKLDNLCREHPEIFNEIVKKKFCL